MRVILIALASLLALNIYAQSSNDVTISPQNNTQPENIFDSFSIVTLQLSKESRLPPLSVGKIKKYVGKYFFEDVDDHSLLIFGANGQFLNKIKPQKSFFDFDIYNNAIYILENDFDNQHILKYSINGDYITEYSTDSWYKNLVILNDKDILLFSNYSNNSGYNYVILNTEKQQTIITWEPMKNEHYTYVMNPFYRIGNQVFVTKAFNHTIYKFSGNNLSPYLNLYFSNTDKLPKAKTMLEKMQKAGNVVELIQNITRTSQKLYFSYLLSSNNQSVYHICSIDDKNKLVADLCLSNMHENAKIPFVGTLGSLTEGHCIMYLSMSEANKLSSNSQLTPNDAEKLKNADNLVIIDYKLK